VVEIISVVVVDLSVVVDPSEGRVVGVAVIEGVVGFSVVRGVVGYGEGSHHTESGVSHMCSQVL